MKLTKTHLKRIIKEELGEMSAMEAPPAPPLPIELTREQIEWLDIVVETFDGPDSDIQMQQSILDALRAGGQKTAPEPDTDPNSLIHSAFSYVDSKLDANPELKMGDMMQDPNFAKLMQDLFAAAVGSSLFGGISEDELGDAFEGFVEMSSEARKAHIERNIS